MQNIQCATVIGYCTKHEVIKCLANDGSYCINLTTMRQLRGTLLAFVFSAP